MKWPAFFVYLNGINIRIVSYVPLFVSHYLQPNLPPPIFMYEIRGFMYKCTPFIKKLESDFKILFLEYNFVVLIVPPIFGKGT